MADVLHGSVERRRVFEPNSKRRKKAPAPWRRATAWTRRPSRSGGGAPRQPTRRWDRTIPAAPYWRRSRRPWSSSSGAERCCRWTTFWDACGIRSQSW